MDRFSWKKLTSLFFAAYTAIAVVGAFSFAAADSLRSLHFEAKSPVLGSPEFGGLIPDNYVIPHQAEVPMVITKPGANQFSPLRMGFQRIAFLFGTSNSGNTFSKSPFWVSPKIQHANLKKNILLKLRI
jgi:hypothetical protein